MADQDSNPVFQIQRMYLKDLSLEQPNSPQILLEQQQPQVDINPAMGAGGIADGCSRSPSPPPSPPRSATGRCSWSRPSRPASSRSATSPKTSCRASSAWCARRWCTLPAGHRVGRLHACRLPADPLTEVNFQAMFEAQQQALAAGGNGGAPPSTTARPHAHFRCSALARGARRWRRGGGTPPGGAVGPRPGRGRTMRRTGRNERYLPEVPLPQASS